MNVVTISSKYQVTLPVTLVRDLALVPKDRLVIDRKNDDMILIPLRDTIINQTAGSLASYIAPDKSGREWKDILNTTKRKVAKKLATT